MHPMFVIVLAQRSLTKLNTMSNLIKEGYFNLSTELNSKSLWMHLARRHPNQSIRAKTKEAWIPKVRLCSNGDWWTRGYIPECTYHLHVGWMSSYCCSGGMVIFCCWWLLHFLCKLKWRRTHRPCWLRWQQGWVTHTASVQEPWPWLHAPLARWLEVQNTSPFACASEC